MTPAPAAPLTPKAQLEVPALLILGMGALGALSALVGVVTGVSPDALEPSLQPLRQLPEAAPVVHFFEAAPRWVRPLNGVALAFSVLMVVGGLRMRSLRGYGWSVAGALAAMLPLSGCCCCVGLPVGVWALAVLRRPEVKAAFATGTGSR